WAAVRAGDLAAVKTAVEKGADVNARNEYGVTALWIAASKEKLDVVEFLVGKGADVNARDDIWYLTSLTCAVGEGHAEIVKFLVKAGAKDVDPAVVSAAAAGKSAIVQAVLDTAKVNQETLDAALFAASNDKVKDALTKAGAKPLPPASADDKKAWAKLPGTYEADGGHKLTVALKEPGLVFNQRWVKQTGPDAFAPPGVAGTSYRVQWKDGEVARITVKRFTAEYSFYRFKEPVVTSVASATSA